MYKNYEKLKIKKNYLTLLSDQLKFFNRFETFYTLF